MKLKKFKFDILLISILVLSLVSWLVIWGFTADSKNKKAVIEYNNEVIMELDLAVDKEFELYELENGKKLNHKMIIKIENGKIWVKENECHNQDCVKMGKKSKVGDEIICLPNKILIRIEKL